MSLSRHEELMSDTMETVVGAAAKYDCEMPFEYLPPNI